MRTHSLLSHTCVSRCAHSCGMIFTYISYLQCPCTQFPRTWERITDTLKAQSYLLATCHVPGAGDRQQEPDTVVLGNSRSGGGRVMKEINKGRKIMPAGCQERTRQR